MKNDEEVIYDDVTIYNAQNFKERKESIYDCLQIIIGLGGLTLLILTSFYIFELPSIIANENIKNPNNIKIGCLYFVKDMSQMKGGTLIRIEQYPNMDMFQSYIKNTPFYDRKKRMNFFINQLKHNPNYCHRIKYVEADLKLFKTAFIYDTL